MPDNVGDVRGAREPYGYPEMKTTQRNAVSAPEETVDAIKAWL